MPKFPAFGKRKSAMPKEDGEVVPSFRVLERTDQVGVKSFDDPRAVRRPVSTVRPYSQADTLAPEEENMFVNLHANRYVVFFFLLVRGRRMFVLANYNHRPCALGQSPSTTALGLRPPFDRDAILRVTSLDHTPVYSSKR